MNNLHSLTGMNLYEGYLSLQKKRRGGDVQRRAAMVIPIVTLLLGLLGVGGYIGVQNIGLRQQVQQIQTHIETLQPAYAEASLVVEENDQKQTLSEKLTTERMLFNLYPALGREVFTQVRACAENVFIITQYEYDEASCVLRVQANAASVNAVPKLVERLRETELFRSVQYTGYTSDSSQRYYCIVGCTLGGGTETTE